MKKITDCYYTFDAAGNLVRHENGVSKPIKTVRAWTEEPSEETEKMYRELWDEWRKPKPSPKDSPKPEKPTAAEKPTGGETVKTNATEAKNNGVHLNPDLLRRYSLVEFGKEVTLFEMIQDPRHHTREWEAVIHILTGTKEYKSEYDERMDDFFRRWLD